MTPVVEAFAVGAGWGVLVGLVLSVFLFWVCEVEAAE